MTWKTKNEEKFDALAIGYTERKLHGAIGTYRLYRSEAHARAAMKRKGLRCVSEEVTRPCILDTELEYRLHPEFLPERPIGKLLFRKVSAVEKPEDTIIACFRMRKK